MQRLCLSWSCSLLPRSLRRRQRLPLSIRPIARRIPFLRSCENRSCLPPVEDPKSFAFSKHRHYHQWWCFFWRCFWCCGCDSCRPRLPQHPWHLWSRDDPCQTKGLRRLRILLSATSGAGVVAVAVLVAVAVTR